MTAQPLRIDKRDHVEKPLLDQLARLGWEIVDLDNKQRPADSFRESFAEVVMLPVLREQLKVINPWLEEDQVEEAIRQLTAGFPGTGLLENNRHVFSDSALRRSARCRRRGERASVLLQPVRGGDLPGTSVTGIGRHEEAKHEHHARPDQGGAGSADE